MQSFQFEFERPIKEIEKRIKELSEDGAEPEQIEALKKHLENLKKEIFSNLSPFQRLYLARHPKRPVFQDYIQKIFEDFIELHGDRNFGDDKAICCGIAKIDKIPVFLIGHRKGRDTKENLIYNFGMAHPEGYRKACRIARLAEKFNRPLISFVDTPGAYPGIGAEERGQGEAIAQSIYTFSTLEVPIIVLIIGEGGSGGALAIGVGDRILMLENAIYSVISPEGCAAILWKDSSKVSEAAEALALTADDLLRLGLIDRIIKEPLGGAHLEPEATFAAVKECILEELYLLRKEKKRELLRKRREKFKKMGIFKDSNEKKGNCDII